MVVTYCTADDVGSLLGITIDGSSKPTTTEVEKFINRKEDYIDDKSGHAWRSVTITDEYVSPTNSHIYGTGVPFKLLHRKIRSVSKLERWDGSQWEDLVATGTEGRNDDYWIDYTNGIIYIRSHHRFFKDSVRATYTFGDTTVKGTVEDLCVVLAAIDVLRRRDKLVNFTEDGGTISITKDRKIESLKEEADDLFSEIYEFVRIV